MAMQIDLHPGESPPSTAVIHRHTARSPINRRPPLTMLDEMYKKVSRDNGPEHIGRHYRSQSGNPAESTFVIMSLTAVYVRCRPEADIDLTHSTYATAAD